MRQVVAVLLDNFIRAVRVEKENAMEEEEQARMKQLGVSKVDVANPLDPLLEALSRFRSEARTPRTPASGLRVRF
jgi:hypothetical protein